MYTTNFNFLPLEQRANLIFPAAKLLSSNQNEAFQISFYALGGATYEVCYDLDTQSIEDIRLIEERALTPTVKGFILGFK